LRTKDEVEQRETEIKTFLGLNPEDASEDPRSSRKSGLAINEDNDERRPLLASPVVEAAGESDVEQDFPDKAKHTKAVFTDALTADLEASLAQFLTWTEGLLNNPKLRTTSLGDWIHGLIHKHQQVLGNTTVEQLRNYINAHPEVSRLQVSDWLNAIRAQALIHEANRAALLPQPLERETFFDLIKQVTTYEMIHSQMMDNVDPRTKAFLTYVQKYLVEEIFNRKQWALGGLGVAAAIGSSIAQGPIFGSAMFTFEEKVGLKKYFAGNAPAGLSTVIFTTVTSFFDSLPRDWEEFTALGAAGKGQFIPHKTKFGWVVYYCQAGTIYVLASPMTWLAVYYFYDREYTNGIKWLEDNPDAPNRETYIKETWAFLGSLVVPLAADALAGTVHQMRAVGRLAEAKWRRLTLRMQGSLIAELPLLSRILKHQPRTEVEIQRDDFLKTLKNLHKAVYVMDDEEVEQVYNQVYKPLFKSQKEKGTDQLNASEAFETLAWFLKHFAPSAEEEVEEEHQAPFACISKTWKDRLSEGLGIFFAATASFARYLTYQFVMRSLFSFLGIENEIALELCSNFCASIGWFVQGLTEEMSMEENVNGFLNKEAHSRTSHPHARKVTTGISTVLGVYYTLPYLVTGWLAMADYPLFAQVLCLTPYIMADSHSNGWFLKDTYGSYVHMYDRIKTKFFPNCCGGVDPNYKRDRVLRWLERISDLAQEADPKVIVDLHQKLEVFNRAELAKRTQESEEKEKQPSHKPRKKGRQRKKASPNESGSSSNGSSLSEVSSDEDGFINLGSPSGSINRQEGSFRELQELRNVSGELLGDLKIRKHGVEEEDL
ncbi:MAG TPA: hypothetical protein VMW10_01250, partial [Alphaproteobacteria bacterium]|nr:hypothetical protein [Alphaproteobacteria bacterium]